MASVVDVRQFPGTDVPCDFPELPEIPHIRNSSQLRNMTSDGTTPAEVVTLQLREGRLVSEVTDSKETHQSNIFESTERR